jgi:hypothetical protein
MTAVVPHVESDWTRAGERTAAHPSDASIVVKRLRQLCSLSIRSTSTALSALREAMIAKRLIDGVAGSEGCFDKPGRHHRHRPTSQPPLSSSSWTLGLDRAIGFASAVGSSRPMTHKDAIEVQTECLDHRTLALTAKEDRDLAIDGD